MQRDVTFSGPIEEGYTDGNWVIGGLEINRPLEDALKELCDGVTSLDEQAFRVDIYLDPYEEGFNPSLVGTLGGTIMELMPKHPEVDMTMNGEYYQTDTLRGEVNYDPYNSAFLLGASNILDLVINRIAILIGRYVGSPATVNLSVVMTLEESTGYDDPKVGEMPDRVVSVSDGVRGVVQVGG